MGCTWTSTHRWPVRRSNLPIITFFNKSLRASKMMNLLQNKLFSTANRCGFMAIWRFSMNLEIGLKLLKIGFETKKKSYWGTQNINMNMFGALRTNIWNNILGDKNCVIYRKVAELYRWTRLWAEICISYLSGNVPNKESSGGFGVKLWQFSITWSKNCHIRNQIYPPNWSINLRSIELNQWLILKYGLFKVGHCNLCRLFVQ